MVTDSHHTNHTSHPMNTLLKCPIIPVNKIGMKNGKSMYVAFLKKHKDKLLKYKYHFRLLKTI